MQGFAMAGYDIQDILERIDGDFPQSLERLFEFLRFPSIGTDPAHHADCQRTAEWVKQQCDTLGFATTIRPTTGQPVVVAKYEPPKHIVSGRRHLPHVLFYGHYDVQPADPLELWTTPPFEPRIALGKDGRDCIFARGACDDKGQVMTFLEASRAWLKVAGHLPFRLTLLIEGDEEGDDVHLDRFVSANRDVLKADVALVCDTGLWESQLPAIVTSLRGVIAEELTITGPKIDLHSGYFGGPAINPLKVLSKILGDIHDAKGRITIPGFYNGIKLLTSSERKVRKRIPFSERSFMKGVGLTKSVGDQDYTVLEQLWDRPTAEVNGIWGGYTGAGSKTVLPAQASAKLTFRLVVGQNPVKVRKAFRDYVKSKLPKDCKVCFTSHGGNSQGIKVQDSSHWIAKAKAALKNEWEIDPVLVGEGGSVPVVEGFKKHLGIDSVCVGFSNDDDALHSPNEKYNVESYQRGARFWARFMHEISEDKS
jgi:acetylornithine deacetylase/succinyl-diaminopimelate desuccinylase-like protein